MKNNKLFLLGLGIPLLSLVLTSCNGGNKISFEDAMAFAKENHDPHQYDGYNVSYGIDFGTTKIDNARVLAKRYYSPYSKDFYLEETYRGGADLSGIKGTLVWTKTLCITSYYVSLINDYVTTYSKAATDYLDASFVKDGNHLGYVIETKKDLVPIINLAGAFISTILNILPLKDLPEFIKSIKSLSASSFTISLDLEITRFGFFDSLYIGVNLKDACLTLTDDGIGTLDGNYIYLDELNLDAKIDATYTI